MSLIASFIYRVRNSKQAVLVPASTDDQKPPSVRSIQRQRDIYLPEENHMTLVNNGYLPEHSGRPEADERPVVVSHDVPLKETPTDTIEVIENDSDCFSDFVKQHSK